MARLVISLAVGLALVGMATAGPTTPSPFKYEGAGGTQAPPSLIGKWKGGVSEDEYNVLVKADLKNNFLGFYGFSPASLIAADIFVDININGLIDSNAPNLQGVKAVLWVCSKDNKGLVQVVGTNGLEEGGAFFNVAATVFEITGKGGVKTLYIALVSLGPDQIVPPGTGFIAKYDVSSSAASDLFQPQLAAKTKCGFVKARA